MNIYIYICYVFCLHIPYIYIYTCYTYDLHHIFLYTYIHIDIHIYIYTYICIHISLYALGCTSTLDCNEKHLNWMPTCHRGQLRGAFGNASRKCEKRGHGRNPCGRNFVDLKNWDHVSEWSRFFSYWLPNAGSNVFHWSNLCEDADNKANQYSFWRLILQENGTPLPGQLKIWKKRVPPITMIHSGVTLPWSKMCVFHDYHGV